MSNQATEDVEELSWIPLGAPGMPPVGLDFLLQAQNEGDGSEIETVKLEDGKTLKRVKAGETLLDLYWKAMRHPGFSMNIAVRPGLTKLAAFVIGHIWSENATPNEDGDMLPVTGPHRADVMVIGKNPGTQEVADGRCFTGKTGQLFIDVLQSCHVPNAQSWYVTNLVKFMPPDGSNNLKKSWVKDCLPILHQELRIVQPKYILCLGSDASKALFNDSKATVTQMEGRVEEIEFPLDLEMPADPKDLRMHKALVMTVIHPAAVDREPTLRRTLERGIARFNLLISGARFDQEETDIDHREIHDIDQLRSLLYEIDHDPDFQAQEDRWISVDAEWHGEHPANHGSYLRTIQISWKPKCAAALLLTRPGGQWCFTETEDAMEYHQAKTAPAVLEVIALLNEFFLDKRVMGHFLVADLEWLVDFGLTQIRDSFRVPIHDKPFNDFSPEHKRVLARRQYYAGDIVPAWARTYVEGGWDTGLAAHAVEETAALGLEMLTLRYTTCPRYDTALNDFKTKFCKEHGLKAKDLEGYGEIPDSTLIPYACLHQGSLVQLEDGTWKAIGQLVKQKYAGNVRALYRGQIINAPVIGWHRHVVNQKEWFQVRTVSTERGRWGLLGPVFTPDHRILTQRGEVPVTDLQPNLDCVITDDLEFSAEQLSVVLGSGLGDGGWMRKNDAGVGFGFGQRPACAAYADWKAEVLASHNPHRISMKNGHRRYALLFSRYLTSLSKRFPSHPAEIHGKRKLVISCDLLDQLGDLGLAVWYQDDGTLVRPHGGTQCTSRIYCRIGEEEQQRVVAWLTAKFGVGVRYNTNNRFIQFTSVAFKGFHAAINAYMHPVMAYKTVLPVIGSYKIKPQNKVYYCDRIAEILPWAPAPGKRGYGVRYCLTVEKAHNFLTKIGFVSNCYDGDATLRLGLEQQVLVDSDYEGNNCRESFWESMLTTMPILEMHLHGTAVDKQMIDDQTRNFMEARTSLEKQIRDHAVWPELNLRSVMQVREFLFGDEYNGKRDKQGNNVRIRPLDAITLGLEPLVDTSKPPVSWAVIQEKGTEKEHVPGTNKTVLGILAQEHQDMPEGTWVQKIRDHRFVDQTLKSVLRPPVTDDQGSFVFEGDADYDNDSLLGFGGTGMGGLLYDAGLASVICDDGRVRTHFYPTAETKRWKSARPPLQNLAKRRDADYERILGEDKYKHKLRSIFVPSPGCLLVEADFTGAELLGAALMAGDALMIEHCRRNALPENHSEYYDIHSNIAVAAFKLVCEPTKKGLKAIGKGQLRIAAKTVVFGLMYGRGAKAIAFEVKMEGVNITIEEAQMIIDAVYEMYPALRAFFEACQQRVHDPGWLCSCFGAFRRFPAVISDRTMAGEFERQSQNWPIQSMVASAMDRALAYLQDYRDNVIGDPNYFRMLLQIHDAVLLEVPYANVDHVVKRVIPYNLSERVNIYPSDLDGIPTGAGPYHFGAVVEVFERWGEQLSKERCLEIGVPLEYAGEN